MTIVEITGGMLLRCAQSYRPAYYGPERKSARCVSKAGNAFPSAGSMNSPLAHPDGDDVVAVLLQGHAAVVTLVGDAPWRGASHEACVRLVRHERPHLNPAVAFLTWFAVEQVLHQPACVDSKAIEYPSLQDSPLPLPISPIEKTGRSLYQDFRTRAEILAVKLDRFLDPTGTGFHQIIGTRFF